MLSMFVALAMGAAVAAEAPAPAEAPAAVAPITVKTKNDANRIVCKNDAPTGSRLGKAVCKTKAEWDEQRARDKQMLLERQTAGQLQKERG
jgi:hypothetical protein